MKVKSILIVFGFVVLALAPTVLADSAPKPVLEKKVYIHYKKSNVKSNVTKPPKTSTCYTFLASGAKLVGTAEYVIDPTGSGLGETDVRQAIFNSAEVWDADTSKELFGDNPEVVYDGTFDETTRDSRNEFVFGDYPISDVIAVTNAWGYWSGPPSARRIVEFDVMFDTDFVWGDATVDSTKMDLANIATHEIGHGLGLGDLYNSCTEETMYGYSTEGESKKRDLGVGDILGLQKLYGI